MKSTTDIKVADIDLATGKLTSDIEQLNAMHIGMSSNPAWSPSGERLAYLAASSPTERNEYSTLCIWNSHGKRQAEFRLRTPLATGPTGHISWTPDEKYILGAGYANSGGSMSLFRVDTQNGEQRVVASGNTIIGWTRDAAFFFASRGDNNETPNTIAKKDCQSGHEEELFRIAKGFFNREGDILSPDGKWSCRQLP